LNIHGISFLKENVSILEHYSDPFTNRASKKRKITKSPKLLFISLEAFRDLFVTVAEAAPQLSPGTRANLHEVGLLLVK
jgi:hypothetical protein